MIAGPSFGSIQYQIEDLGEMLGGGFARARDVNASGLIVGEALIPVAGTVEHGFAWANGNRIDLGTLGGAKSRALAVNNAGVIGGWAGNAAGQSRPVLWQSFLPVELPTLGGNAGFVQGLNELSYAVGNSYLNATSYHATLWAPDRTAFDLGTLGGSFSLAYSINAGGLVGGSSFAAGNGDERAVLWTAGGIQDLGSLYGGSWDAVRMVNDGGAAILWGLPAAATANRASFWSGSLDDPVVDLGTFGGTESWAYGLNNLNNVVGWARLESGIYHAFFWDGTAKTDLGTLGGGFSSAYGINDDGVIVGFAHDAANVTHAVRWVPVEIPEPSSLGLLALAAALVYRRRRQVGVAGGASAGPARP